MSDVVAERPIVSSDESEESDTEVPITPKRKWTPRIQFSTPTTSDANTSTPAEIRTSPRVCSNRTPAGPTPPPATQATPLPERHDQQHGANKPANKRLPPPKRTWMNRDIGDEHSKHYAFVNTCGPTFHDQYLSPVELFELFFDDEMIDLITAMSTNYAQ